jgi:hypothetical protein
VGHLPAAERHARPSRRCCGFPSTFPDGTILTWEVTPDPDWGGINGYLHVSYGNYDDSPGQITPRQVKAITDLAVTVDWTFEGDRSSGLLASAT